MTPAPDANAGGTPDLLCLSHLRWNWVYQRPQHLMSRAARDRRVFVVEEPLHDDGPPRVQVQTPQANLRVLTPLVPPGLDELRLQQLQRYLLDAAMREHGIRRYVAWYYTPMALAFSDHLDPELVVYDCMDELSAFAGAPPRLRALERELLARCDVVFTGGVSLWEAKRDLHPNVHAFPSSVDVRHFRTARAAAEEPADQAPLRRPRLGYFGVLDERVDWPLIAGAAAARRDWEFVLVGPVTKVEADSLPRAANIHYLGPKPYDDLPGYVASWDVALVPFARNEATRFISPTKTPEYLAAGRHVVSTPIRDVVRTYGDTGLVHIAETVPELLAAAEQCLACSDETRLERIDRLLGDQSWDRTWTRMLALMTRTEARAA
jgi:UDP-galactopyranose mutase